MKFESIANHSKIVKQEYVSLEYLRVNLVIDIVNRARDNFENIMNFLKIVKQEHVSEQFWVRGRWACPKG